METKVPLYNIVNVFLPGLVLLGLCVLLFLDEIKTPVQSVANLGSGGLELVVIASFFAIAYEIGYIIFLIGSAVIEPILKKMFGWAEYRDFIAAEKTNDKAHDKLEMLSREYGYARTQITLFIIFTVLTAIRLHWWIMSGSILCVALFTVTVRGHMKRTQKVVRQYLLSDGNKNEAHKG